MNIDLFSAFIVGLLGSGHCIGMCGGITSMLTAALPQNTEKSKTALVLFYHAGRIFSYSFIGALVGFTGSIASKNIGLPLAGMRIIAALFLILLGLYLGQWLMWLNKIESIGKILWNKISPYSKKLIPVDSHTKAISLGFLWGWLPCGLVYSTLTWALASANIINGTLIMLFFGLGTLPALLSISLGAVSIKPLLSNDLFRKSTAIMVILYGIYSIYIAYP